MALILSNVGGGGEIDLSTSVDLDPNNSTSIALTNATDYSLIVAAAMAGHEYVTHNIAISTTDPTTNKYGIGNVVSGVAGGACLAFVPSTDNITISMSSDGQVKKMMVFGVPK